ncbi:MAG: hypothetical protein WC856_21510 [Methylococcaceae bacterium]|jgi:hypothetical protein
MTKDDLIGIFRTAINNCKLTYASILLFSHDDMPSFYGEWSSALEIPRPFDEAEILALLHDREVSKIAFGELYDTVHRAAFKELFEVTKFYCESTNQFSILQRQPWYQFWRIIRNCLSHDFKFRFNEYDLTKLPVSWNSITIDSTYEGKSLTHGDISREELLSFLNEVLEFIKENLT